MLYVIVENEVSGKDGAGAKARNKHIKATAEKSCSTFPGIFGSIVASSADVKKCLDKGGRDAQTLHVFAHGNQQQIGKFANSDDDSFAATDPLARLLRDDLRVFQKKGVARMVLHSCYGGAHISKLAPTIQYFVLPTGWNLTLEGANGAAFTDKAGNLRVASSDTSAMTLDSAIGSGTNAERFDVMLQQHCQAVSQGLERIELVGSYGG